MKTYTQADMEVLRERCAKEVNKWSNAQYLRLHAGEVTAPELRTVRAVLNCLLVQVRSLPIESEKPTPQELAEQRVLAVRGSYDAPGFDACVEAELQESEKP